MITAEIVVESAINAGISFVSGVPDSVLAGIGACFERTTSIKHVVSHNEGGAIALAAGSFLATATVPLVYLQNSGLGNALNPLVSLSSRNVYGIPQVLMIGWRGCPGNEDEPQHIEQGHVTQKILESIGVECASGNRRRNGFGVAHLPCLCGRIDRPTGGRVGAGSLRSTAGFHGGCNHAAGVFHPDAGPDGWPGLRRGSGFHARCLWPDSDQ